MFNTGGVLRRGVSSRILRVPRAILAGRCFRQLGTSASIVEDVQLPSLEDLCLKRGDNVVVAMSGGVDSSLTLRLLAELPLNLSVIFMRNWDSLLSESGPEEEPPTSLAYAARGDTRPHEPNMSPCGWERDWEDVRRVCQHVGVQPDKVQFVDLSREYWSRVFEPAVGVWEAGRTPNPDVACNREIKFGALMNHIPPGSFLATGHYARVRRSAEGATLHRARDANKDQTYYLSQVPEHQLQKAVFPLAGIPKPSVRVLAKHFALPTAEREESMGVCFIGERGHFGDFVSQYTTSTQPGHFVDLNGKRFGEHRGQLYYTIGQRARLGGMQGRWFVARKGVGEDKNDILLVQGGNHPALQCNKLWSTDFAWIAGDPPPVVNDGRALDALVQVRHRMEPVKARVQLFGDRKRGDQVQVSFPDPISAVAAGQIVGIWNGDQCLGSGTIERTQCADETTG